MSTSTPTSIRWRKSAHSDQEGGNCVEVGSWRKSSRSDASGGACVEVGRVASVVAVRDSKDPDGPKLTFRSAAFRTLARDIRAGRYDW